MITDNGQSPPQPGDTMLRPVAGPVPPDEGSTELAPAQAAPWPPRLPWQEWPGWPFVAVALAMLVVLNAFAFVLMAQRVSPSTAATAAPRAAPTASPSPSPTYDLAGYRAAVTGRQAQAYGRALGTVRRDYRVNDFTTGETDAANLTLAANAWLNQISSTNPPPAQRGAKATLMLAIRQGRKAGQATRDAITSTSPLNQLPNGAALTVAAVAALKRAAVNPAGS